MVAQYNKWFKTPGGMVKYCNGCGKVRTEEEYYKSKTSYSGYKSKCIYCVNAISLDWQRRNPARKKANDKAANERLRELQRQGRRQAA